MRQLVGVSPGLTTCLLLGPEQYASPLEKSTLTMIASVLRCLPVAKLHSSGKTTEKSLC